MKKLVLYLCLPLALSSCIKQLEKKFTGETVVEIDAAPLNSNASGADYPVLTRIPVGSRPLSNSLDSTIRRYNGSIQIRVNLVGPQSSSDQTVGYTVFSQSPVATVSFAATRSGQTPSRSAGTLNVLEAQAGVHYQALTGTVTIPANSSYGYITINILDAGATPAEARFLGIQLNNSGTLKPNPNYDQIGIAIDQR